MAKFKKYEFDSEAQADEYINILSTEEYPNHGNHIIKIGFIEFKMLCDFCSDKDFQHIF